MLKKIIFLCLLLFLPIDLAAKENPLILVDQYAVQYLNNKTKEVRAESNIAITNEGDGFGNQYLIEEKGKGQYEDYNDVQWYKYSFIVQQKGQLIVIISGMRILDESEQVLATYTKVYDYEYNKVTFTQTKGESKIVKEKTYPFEGAICDDVSMVHFLAPLLGKKSTFQLITNEPKLYTVKIIEQGVESIERNGEIRSGLKYQLIADFGPGSNLTQYVPFIPKTYVWYSSVESPQWLKYEGMESGYGSKVIESYRK